MTTIRNGAPSSIYPRLADTGGRIPFGLIDTNNSGRISKAELGIALQRIFPSLSDAQCKGLADNAFTSLKGEGLHMDREGWGVAEGMVLNQAKTLDQANAIQTGSAPSGWLDETGMRPTGPMIVGQNQIPLPPVMQPGGYYPRNDLAVTGYNPYQYPMAMPPLMPGAMPGQMPGGMPGYETPVGKMAKGAGRGLLGFLKMIPIVGNIINGIDFIKDIPRAMQSFGNPNLTFMQKLKSGADLLFHGAGMLVPQVGASYDMAQGALRVAGGAIQSMEYGPMAQLPTWQFNNAGFNPMYNMQYQNPMMSNPYAYGQFPNYSQYPSYPAGQAFQPPWLQGNYNMPYPVVPYGTPPMQYPMANYDPFMGSPYGYGYNPYMANPAMTSPMFGTPQDGLAGMGRAALGATKMVPVLGNLINGFDFLRDIGHLGRAMRGDPSQSFMKSASDLLFHGVGMLIPQVGASYDIAQGTMRAGAAAMNPMNFMNRLPPFAFNPGGYNPMYPGTMF